MPDDIQEEIQEQAEAADIYTPNECANDKRVQCATLYGPRAVESKILVSISENINIMAEAIKESEQQKQDEREKCITFFKWILIFLIGMATILTCVRIEFLISVILAILADVFAIVHTLVKYMTNTENYDAYGKLIDSLLKHIEHK